MKIFWNNSIPSSTFTQTKSISNCYILLCCHDNENIKSTGEDVDQDNLQNINNKLTVYHFCDNPLTSNEAKHNTYCTTSSSSSNRTAENIQNANNRRRKQSYFTDHRSKSECLQLRCTIKGHSGTISNDKNPICCPHHLQHPTKAIEEKEYEVDMDWNKIGPVTQQKDTTVCDIESTHYYYYSNPFIDIQGKPSQIKTNSHNEVNTKELLPLNRESSRMIFPCCLHTPWLCPRSNQGNIITGGCKEIIKPIYRTEYMQYINDFYNSKTVVTAKNELIFSNDSNKEYEDDEYDDDDDDEEMNV
ncbi:unnamed protein product [Trichobilharzia regenti]|nr:unnamed protein product [Trichobilharzia regenti]